MQRSANIIDMQKLYECIQHGVEFTIQQLHISRKNVHEICKREHIQIPKKNRTNKEVQQNQIDFVVIYREKFKDGYQRMAHISDLQYSKTIICFCLKRRQIQ